MIELNLKPYFRREDEQGYIYFIPAEEVKLFDDALVDCIRNDSCDNLIKNFSKYQISGTDFQIPVWVDPKDIK